MKERSGVVLRKPLRIASLQQWRTKPPKAARYGGEKRETDFTVSGNKRVRNNQCSGIFGGHRLIPSVLPLLTGEKCHMQERAGKSLCPVGALADAAARPAAAKNPPPPAVRLAILFMCNKTQP